MYMVRYARGSYRVNRLLSLEVATPENKSVRCCHPYARKSASKAVLSRKQLTLATRRTPHGASRLVQAMSAWWVKTRRAPSRHFRDARVYAHTTTAMRPLIVTHGTEVTALPLDDLDLSGHRH